MKVPIIMQMHSGENGAACLAMILAHYGKHLPMNDIRKKCISSRNGSSPRQLYEAALDFGLTGERKEASLEELKSSRLPVIASWKRRYYVVVTGFKKGNVLVNDPQRGVYSISEERFEAAYEGKILELYPGADFTEEGKPVTIVQLLFKRIAAYKRAFMFIVLLYALGVAADLFAIVMGQVMLDQVVERFQVQWYMPIMILMCIALGIRLLFTLWNIFLTYKLSRNMSAKSGSKLFKKLTTMPMKFYDQHYTGELMERLSVNSTLDYSLAHTIFPRIVDGVLATMYLALMFIYHPVIAGVCLLIEIIYIVLSMKLQSLISTVSHSLSSSLGTLSSSLLNALNNIDTVKSTGHERNFFYRWSEAQEEYQWNRRRTLRLNAMATVFAGFHDALTSTVLLFLGAYFYTQGNFTLGMMASMQSILSYLQLSMKDFMKTFNNLNSMRSNLERIEDVLSRNQRPEIPINDGQIIDKLKGRITIENVSFAYNEGDPLAVDDVSLTIEPGQMVALVGHTGCGKSSLIKLIADLYQPLSGKIYYDGRERSQISDAVFRASIATVDQESMIFEDTIFNNLKLWDEMIPDETVFDSAKEAQIHERIMTSKDGYNEELCENGGGFSGGELQRMELTRALCHQPRILVLDEFISALDAITEEKVLDAIKDTGYTCIIAAHRMSAVVDCDQIIVMNRGKIVERGTHQELYAANGMYRRLMDRQ